MRNNSARQGSSIFLRRPVASDFPNGSGFGPRLNTTPQRILTLEMGRDSRISEGGGSWVVNLVCMDGVRLASFCNIKARISFGSGGVSQSIEVDANNQTLSIPGEDVYVDIYWQQLGLAGLGAYPMLDPLFATDTTVKATAYRTPSPANISPPVYTTFVPANAFNYLVEIPPSAYAYTLYPGQRVTAGSLPYQVDVGQSLDRVDNSVSESMARMHQFRQLPTNAGNIDINALNPVTFNNGGSLEFLLNYG